MKVIGVGKRRERGNRADKELDSLKKSKQTSGYRLEEVGYNKGKVIICKRAYH